MAAYAVRDYETMINKLGDAVHVSADRGSHEEGGIGRGHDIRMPRPELGETNTQITGGPDDHMKNWDDNDNLLLNPNGKDVGTDLTEQVLEVFLAKASFTMQIGEPGGEG